MANPPKFFDPGSIIPGLEGTYQDTAAGAEYGYDPGVTWTNEDRSRSAFVGAGGNIRALQDGVFDPGAKPGTAEHADIRALWMIGGPDRETLWKYYGLDLSSLRHTENMLHNLFATDNTRTMNRVIPITEGTASSDNQGRLNVAGIQTHVKPGEDSVYSWGRLGYDLKSLWDPRGVVRETSAFVSEWSSGLTRDKFVTPQLFQRYDASGKPINSAFSSFSTGFVLGIHQALSTSVPSWGFNYPEMWTTPKTEDGQVDIQNLPDLDLLQLMLDS